jgi:hypothetical protein
MAMVNEIGFRRLAPLFDLMSFVGWYGTGAVEFAVPFQQYLLKH